MRIFARRVAALLSLVLFSCASVQPAFAQHATTSLAPAGYAPEQTCVTWSGASIGLGSLIPCGTGGGGGGGSNAAAVAQGSTTSGQLGSLTQGAVVSGDQAYTAGQTSPITLTPTGRLKVGVSSAGNIDPAAQLSTTISSDLVACKYRTPVAWTIGYTAALQCDAAGNLMVSAPALGSPTDAPATTTDTTATTLIAQTKQLVVRINALITALGSPSQAGGPGYCFASTTAPTAATTGNPQKNWCGLNGQSVTVVGDLSGSAAVTQSNNATAVGARQSLSVAAFCYIYNGNSSDVCRKPNLYSHAASSAASGNPAVLKSSAGEFCQAIGVNTAAALEYLQVYNKGSAPVIGTDTPAWTIPIAASSPFSYTAPTGCLYLATGVSYAITTDAAGTTAAAAGTLTALGITGS